MKIQLNTLRFLFAGMLLGFVCSKSNAAELRLRKRCIPSGPVVRLGDVADISASATAQLDDLTTTPLLPTPAPGTREFLRRTQIRDLLASRGIDTHSLIFSGADFVEIDNRKKNRGENSNENSNPALTTTSRKMVVAAVIGAIERHLHHQAERSEWQIELEMSDANYQQLTQLGTTLVASGGRKPWDGRQQFRLETAGGKTRKFARVRARLIRTQPVVVARRAIPRGSLIRSSDVEVRMQSGNIPAHVATELAQVIGKESRRSVSTDALLLENQVRAPLQVKRGESVALYARTAGITIRTSAIAQEDGSLGELVRVETLDKKNQLSAQITGRGEVTVFATGASAADFATLNHSANSSRSSENRR